MPSSRPFAAMPHVLAALIVISSAARAECFICDNVIEFDQALAGCYLDEFDNIIAEIEATSATQAEVDLATCTEAVASGERGLEAIGVFPGQDGAVTVTPGLRQVYMLDEAGARCLRDLLDPLPPFVDPSVLEFHLDEACPS